MDNNYNNTPQPGRESLNERLRRAAEMGRRHIAAKEAREEGRLPHSYQPEEPRQPEPVRQPEPMRQPEAPRMPEPGKPFYSQEPPRRPAGPTPPPAKPAAPKQQPPRKSKTLMIVIIIAAILGIGVLALIFLNSSNKKAMEEQQQQIEQLQLQNEQIQLANEYQSLNNEFAQYENQTALLANDSIVQKYAAAKSQVEKLLNELKNEKNKSAAQIAKLKGEIETLKGILRTYVERINELQQENQSLRTENEEVKAENSQLSQTVQTVSAANQTLNERMTLAEKLNVTGVSLTPLNKKGKREKHVTKARQLQVSFTIPQNNSTPVGKKTIFCRIISPEGELLGNAGSFTFEGSQVRCTASKIIEYQGEEIGGITIYWDVNTALNPGEYTVELFADNYRLASRRFTLNK